MLRLVLPGILVCASCARLPPLSPVAGDGAAIAERCRAAYPHQPWHATHALFATLPLGNHSGLVGATAADPDGLHAVLLSPEGMTLFDGTQDNHDPLTPTLRVAQAVPPFDRPVFASSMMADVSTAYLPPGGPPRSIGSYPTGQTVCRWTPNRGDVTDVQLENGVPRVIRTFSHMRLVREISLVGLPEGGFYPLVVLSVPGAGGYRLEMRLVAHE
jgi:hypothetical protein